VEPAISILLPAYNASATLDACWRSILRQTEQDWQCVLVDDGSHDDTLARARAFARREPRLAVVTTPHRGIVAALDTGLAQCRGRLVARMDADDLMHRDRLRAQRTMLDLRPELAAVGCHVRIFPRAGMGEGLRVYEQWLNAIETPETVRAEAYVECPVVHPTLMIRREILAALGYRECAWPEDYDLVLRLLAHGWQVANVPRRLVSWRENPSRLTWRDPRYGLDRFTRCKAAFLAEGLLARTDRYVLWGYGDTGRALRRALLAHGKRPSHIVEMHAGRLGNVIHDAPVIHPDALRLDTHHPLVASVAGTTARTQIRAALVVRGFRELRDFVCAA
jgi:glycosyltransferase involved in cell wall biosynthesis